MIIVFEGALLSHYNSVLWRECLREDGWAMIILFSLCVREGFCLPCDSNMNIVHYTIIYIKDINEGKLILVYVNN